MVGGGVVECTSLRNSTSSRYSGIRFDRYSARTALGWRGDGASSGESGVTDMLTGGS